MLVPEGIFSTFLLEKDRLFQNLKKSLASKPVAMVTLLQKSQKAHSVCLR